MKKNNHNHLNLKTLYDVRLAKERFRYQLLYHRHNLKEETTEFRDSIADVLNGSFKNTGLMLLKMALLKIFKPGR
jgi:hypothetical protein